MVYLHSPITWFGGKSNMVPRLLRLLPPHQTYVEPFGGAASLLLAKPPSPVEVYNDLDSGCVNFFRVLRDEEGLRQLQRKAVYTPYSREEFYRCRDTWQDCEDPVERAYRWFVSVRMSFAGNRLQWSFSRASSSGGMALRVKAWQSATERLAEVHNRLWRVQIEHDDFRTIFKTYDTPETLFYCDPPYVPETRTKWGRYACEMSASDHSELVVILLGLQGKVLLSGYRHSLYDPLEGHGWQRFDFAARCKATGGTRGTGLGVGARTGKHERTESVWVSPNATAGWPPAITTEEE